MNTGKSITILLHDRSMKKKDLAAMLDMTPATVTTLCKEETCSGKMIDKLCIVFDIKASEFIALGE